MKDKKLRKLVRAALLAALTCVATLILLPFPFFTKGYFNMGDCIVLLSGWMLGPWYGMAAGGIGSMLSDLILGYALYAPATLIIKALEAMTASLLFACLARRARRRLAGTIVSAAVGGIVMVGGYFGFEALYYGAATALISIPGNAMQAVANIVIAVLVSELFHRTGAWDKIDK